MLGDGAKKSCRGFTSPEPIAKTESGATIVEFALVAGLFLFLSLGVITFSRVLAGYVYFSDAFEKAVRDNFVQNLNCGQELTDSLNEAVNGIFLSVSLTSPPICTRRLNADDSPSNYCEVRTTAALPCELCSLFFSSALTSVQFSTIVYLEDPDLCPAS